MIKSSAIRLKWIAVRDDQKRNSAVPRESIFLLRDIIVVRVVDTKIKKKRKKEIFEKKEKNHTNEISIGNSVHAVKTNTLKTKIGC